MAAKKFEGAPFGSQSARFDVSAVHPNCKKKGSYTQVPYCKVANSYEEQRLGPGRYDVTQGDFIPCNVLRKASGPGWKRAQETEKLTQMPHILYKEMWEKQRFLKHNMGPGRYTMKDFLELAQMRQSSKRGLLDTREPRFREAEQFVTPGPGTYGKEGNPYYVIEEKEKRGGPSQGIMHSGSVQFKPLQVTGSNLAPGTYNVRNYTDDMLNRVISKRGPYDVFSGDRSKIVYGHYATPEGNNLAPGAYEVRSFIDDLFSPDKRKHGVFGSISQGKIPRDRIFKCILTQCAIGVDSPGPATYDIRSSFSAPVKHRHPPFLSSAMRFDSRAMKLFFTSDNPVGVGRYDITKPIHGKTDTSYRSSFLSKREGYLENLERDKTFQERVKSTNTAATRREPIVFYPIGRDPDEPILEDSHCILTRQ